MIDETPGIEVDQHSITIGRYQRGLSKFETRWGTFTDPWTERRSRNAASFWSAARAPSRATTYEDHVTIQTRKQPRRRCAGIRSPPAPIGVEYVLARIEDGAPIAGPLDPALALVGPATVDSAFWSSRRADGAAGRMTERPNLDRLTA